jgi:hypothetical protein
VTDDPTISDETELWRRIPHAQICYDANLGRQRPESWAFSDDPDGQPMSVFIGPELASPQAALAGLEGFAAIKAGLARALNQAIVRDPTPEQPAHAVVRGPKPASVRKRFAREATWVIPPPA